MIDDRDKQLLQFLRENAGRPYSIKLLSEKFGYKNNGSGRKLRIVLDEFLIEGHPVRRITAGKLSGALYCLQWEQMSHYSSKLRERAQAIVKKAELCELRAMEMKNKTSIVSVRL